MGDIVRKRIHEEPKLISWIDLPRDVTANILQRLGAIEILESAQKVCTTWWRVCKEDPSMWRVIDMKNSDDDGDLENLVLMCRRAVDLSLGELIDIDIEFFGTDDLLRYISDRSSRLKRLSIATCGCITGCGLTAAVKKFPELEELHLFHMPWIKAGDIEAIGICCPMLKLFTFNNRGIKFPVMDDNYALTIAKNMPNLLHLGLFGNLSVDDEGLQAILDGCPHLESLDIRKCFRVELRGDLDKICSQRIKDLRRPFDSTADYVWDDELDADSADSYDYGDFEVYGLYDDNFYNDYEDYGPYEDYNDIYDPNEFPFMDTEGYSNI